MQVHLTLKRSGAEYVYAIPVWYRITTIAIAAILTLSTVVAGGTGVFGAIIIGIVIIAALYEERWTFNTISRTIRGRIGLVFAAKGPSIGFDDVERLRLDVFAKGQLDQSALPPADRMPRGSQARIIVDTKGGDSFMVDSVPFGRRAELERTARALAEVVNAPLEGSSG
ncbi:MAG: hypothetical protein JXM71_07910 [Spirochaetales bacterium]|nr:hypothetical protein [Spirochaetales bacterium]